MTVIRSSSIAIELSQNEGTDDCLRAEDNISEGEFLRSSLPNLAALLDSFLDDTGVCMDEKTDEELGAMFRCWIEDNGLLQDGQLDHGGPQVERFIRRDRSQ